MKSQNFLNRSCIKRVLSKKGYRINKKNIERVSSLVSGLIFDILEKVTRNARISGRKTIKKEDIDNLNRITKRLDE